MDLVLNIIILILEALYFSLFVLFSKKENKFWKTLIFFIMLDLFFFFVGSNNLISYFLLITLIVLGLKYIVKIKTTMFDMLFIFIMMIFKIIIEGISSIFISQITDSRYIMATLLGFIKLPILLIFKNTLSLLYNKLESYWNNNVFYIRYIFTTLMLIYVIASCGFLIFNK